MKQIFLAIMLLAGLACSPATETNTAPVATIQSPNKVQIAKLADDVWVHTTLYDIPGTGIVPSNGMAVADGDSLILIDTAWGEVATQAMIAQLEAEAKLPVKQVIITNYKNDRLAGVDWLEAKGVQSFTHPETPQLSAKIGTPVPNQTVAGLKEPKSRTALGPIEIIHPGPAYSPGNLMVYIKEKDILFGGCMVRHAKSQTMGNISDADLSKWGQGLNWVKQTYPNTKIVVPCRGQVGNASLLDHTMAVLAKTVNSKSDSGTEP